MTPPENAATTGRAAWTYHSMDRQPWRPGRKVGRTIYAQVFGEASDDDVLIGVMDTPEIARQKRSCVTTFCSVRGGSDDA